MEQEGTRRRFDNQAGQIWDLQAAKQGLGHWRALSDRDALLVSADQEEMLKRVFGASWHFTRYACMLGAKLLPHIDGNEEQAFSELLPLPSSVHQAADEQEMNSRLQDLRADKNRLMFYALICFLRGHWDQERLEHELTCIADAVLGSLLRLHGLAEEVLVLGMGRLAGFEMNFASDLDLIFLAEEESLHFDRLVRRIRRMLRAMAYYDPGGKLYEVDMRLRPHGGSGTLITSVGRFVEYHCGEREVWERQVMARHRILHGEEGACARAEQALNEAIYQDWDEELLRSEIANMRAAEERTVIESRGKCHLKKSPGGIMDIDFITHFVQLTYGHRHAALRNSGTRNALRQACILRLLPAVACNDLLQAYDWLKRVECVLRIFDMKNDSVLPMHGARTMAAVRAMGYGDVDPEKAHTVLMEECRAVTTSVRRHFTDIVGSTSRQGA
ncbi:MAG: [protein-PII] uridylyltransferase family protein [Candidatus Eutrophobiaceae bacterium]